MATQTSTLTARGSRADQCRGEGSRRARTWAAALAAVALTGVLAGPTQAATRTFTGQVSSDWNTARNWSPAVVPTSSDDVVISVGRDPILEGAGSSVRSVVLSRGAGLRVSGGVTLSMALTGASGSSFAGNVRVRGGATLVLGGATTWSDGTWLVGGPGAGGTTAGGTIENHGRLSISGDVLASPLDGGLLCNRPGATITREGSSGTVRILVPLDNDGALNVNAGTLALAGGTGGEISEGSFVIAQDALLSSSNGQRLSSSARVIGAGTLRLDSHTFEVVAVGSADVNYRPGTTLVSGGRLDLGGGVGFTGRLTSDGSDGTVSNGDLFVGDGASRLDVIRFDHATVVFGSQATIAATGHVFVSDLAIVALNGTTTWLDGTWLVGGTGGGGTIANQGSLSISGNVLASNLGDGLLRNRPGATITREGSSGTATINVPLDNEGLVAVQTGTLATTDVEQRAGEITVAGSATLGASAASTLTITGGALSSSGTVRGAVAIAGGELHGAGTIKGLLENLAGEVVPGPGPATLRIEGDFTQFREGTLRLELGGLAAGTESDLLEISGAARLDGERRVLAMPSFQPTVDERVEVLRYAKRQGVFARVPGLDLAAGRHLRASYEEPGGPGTAGSLWLRVTAQALPAECSAPQRPLVWADDNDAMARILSQSDSAAALANGLSGRYDVLTTEPLPPHLGLTGRSNQSPNDRGRVGFQFAWSRLASLFQWTSIFNHEAGHAQQALRQRFVSSEAAPFMTVRDYAVLRWSGEEGAYRVQATGLDEIADAVPNFERCRAEILTSDPCVERMSAGRPEEARKEIAALFEYPLLETEWRQHRNITLEERAKLADVETRVQTLLATPEWQAEVARWQNRLPP
jgi:hypothetical protein